MRGIAALLLLVFVVEISAIDCWQKSDCSSCLEYTYEDYLLTANDTFCIWCEESKTCKESFLDAINTMCPNGAMIDFQNQICPELYCPLRFISLSPYVCTKDGTIAFWLNLATVALLIFHVALKFYLNRKLKQRIEKSKLQLLIKGSTICECCGADKTLESGKQALCKDCRYREELVGNNSGQSLMSMFGLLGPMNWIAGTFSIQMLILSILSLALVISLLGIALYMGYRAKSQKAYVQLSDDDEKAEAADQDSVVLKDVIDSKTDTSRSEFSDLKVVQFKYALSVKLSPNEKILFIHEQTSWEKIRKSFFVSMLLAALLYCICNIVLVVKTGSNPISRFLLSLLPSILALTASFEWNPPRCFVVTNKNILHLTLDKRIVKTQKIAWDSLERLVLITSYPLEKMVDPTHDILDLPNCIASMKFTSKESSEWTNRRKTKTEFTFNNLSAREIIGWKQVLQTNQVAFQTQETQDNNKRNLRRKNVTLVGLGVPLGVLALFLILSVTTLALSFIHETWAFLVFSVLFFAFAPFSFSVVQIPLQQSSLLSSKLFFSKKTIPLVE